MSQRKIEKVDNAPKLLDIELNSGFLNKIQEYNISKYLDKGENEVIYQIPEINKAVKVYIDFSSQEKEDK